MPDRTYVTIASTKGSADNLDRNKTLSQHHDDSVHDTRSKDLDHVDSTRNDNSYGERHLGPSPAIVDSSRPTTPGNSSKQAST